MTTFKTFKTISLVFLLIVTNILVLKAQEIEVTTSDIWIRGKDVNAYMKIGAGGDVAFVNQNASTPSAFLINIPSSSQQAFAVRTNWASPANFCVYGNGTAFVLNTAVTSDSTLKTDITPLESQIDNIKKLKSVSYKWKEKSLKGEKKSFGFLAQDLEKIYPDMVFTNDSGVKAIFYDELIPVLVDVFNEQQNQIEEQQELINKLTTRIETIESDCCNNAENLKSASLNDARTTTIDDEAKLYQNTPNPFSVSTTIRYYVPQSVSNATINIYNMNGTQLKSIQLHQTGEGSIEINGGEFNAGMYLYALIANGQIIDTKRMVLTD